MHAKFFLRAEITSTYALPWSFITPLRTKTKKFTKLHSVILIKIPAYHS